MSPTIDRSGLPSFLENEVRRFDAELKQLLELGLTMSGPGWFAKFKARQAELRERHQDKERVRREADRLLPELLGLYLDGGDADRAFIRGLLEQCRWFRWSLGWNVARPEERMTEDDLRRQLAIFSMKDQGSDWRDAILWLDGICRRAGASRLDLAKHLRDIAQLSSDAARFKGQRSTRAMMLDYAARAEGGSAPKA